MQFEGKKGIALFIAIIAIACGIGFGSGLLLGRRFPAHSFQKFGQYLLDPTTGHVCDPFKDPKSDQIVEAIRKDKWAQYMVDPTTGKIPSESEISAAAAGGPTYPPACGK
jgi:hypothetical protein